MIHTFYSPTFYADTPTLSMRKMPLIAEGIKQEKLGVLLEAPQGDIVGMLKNLHSPSYVDAFLNGVEPLASSNGFDWTIQIRDGVLAMNEAMIAGAEMALERGVCSALTQGMHHAVYERGDAFCTFNGLALVAHMNSAKQVFVLDCDEHQGNGTAEFTNRLENLWNFSIFGTRMDERTLLNERSHERMVSGWAEYESALWDGLLEIERVQPDLVIYQAGVDCYKNDGMGQAGLRSSELIARDRIVFEFLRDTRTNVLFVMAGGYHQEYAIINHINTFRVAYEVYYGHRKNVNCGTILD